MLKGRELTLWEFIWRVIGSVLIGYQYGWTTGIAIYLISWSIAATH